MTNKFLGILSLVLLGSGIFADSNNFYIGGQYHLSKYDESGLSAANLSGLGLTFGKYIIKDVAIEGRYVTGLSGDSIDFSGTKVDIDLDNIFSIFLKGDLSITDEFKAYGLIGHSTGKIKFKTPVISISGSDSSISYGLGAQYAIKDDISIHIEYILYLNEDNYDYKGINFGIKYLFSHP